LRTQTIPASFPVGNYSFNAYAGIYPDTVWDSDSFTFEKTLAGLELWVARYNGPANSFDAALSLALDSVGNVYVTGGSTSSGNNHDYTTIKYDASGNQLWVALYDGPVNALDQAHSIAVDGDGNVYVTGQSPGSGTAMDYATLKYDTNGNQLWVARYNGPANSYDYAYSLAVDGGGNVYVTGMSWGIGTYYDYATIKYDTNGIQIWVARASGPGYGLDKATSLALDESGNVYVTGYSPGGGMPDDYVTIKYDAAGNQVWRAHYNGPGNDVDHASSIAVDSSGNVYVTGQSVGSGTAYDYATVKYDASGDQLWIARYNGPANGDENATALKVDGAGNAYVTGLSAGIGTVFDYATIKYDTYGNRLWVARYNGPGNGEDYPTSLAVDGAGNAYVTGYCAAILPPGNNLDYITVKYNSAGLQQWVAGYNGPTNDEDRAQSLAVDESGNVYVTGTSDFPGDFATIKYLGGNLDSWLPVEAVVLGQPLPQEFALHQNYPNPFNGLTALSYQLSADSHVSLNVYDPAGRLVEILVDGWRSAGAHELTFDASHLPSGMYFAKLEAGDYVGVQKLILLK
jgi:hypothetical protein